MDFFYRLSVVDVSALILIMLGIIHGIRKGLSGELSGLIGLTGALIAGLYSFAPCGAFIARHTRLGEQASKTLAFVLITAGVIVTVLLVRILLGRIMKLVVEPTLDRIGGFFVGLLMALIVVVSVYIAMNMCPNPYLNRKFGEESVFGRQLLKYKPAIRSTIDQEIAPAFEKGKGSFKVED